MYKHENVTTMLPRPHSEQWKRVGKRAYPVGSQEGWGHNIPIPDRRSLGWQGEGPSRVYRRASASFGRVVGVNGGGWHERRAGDDGCGRERRRVIEAGATARSRDGGVPLALLGFNDPSVGEQIDPYSAD